MTAASDPRVTALTDPAAGYGALIDCAAEPGSSAREASEMYAGEVVAVLDQLAAGQVADGEALTVARDAARQAVVDHVRDRDWSAPFGLVDFGAEHSRRYQHGELDPLADVAVTAVVTRLAAAVRAMCTWTAASPFCHDDYHAGEPHDACPYEAAAAVLLGRPDPRPQAGAFGG